MPFMSYRATLAQPGWHYLTGIADMLSVETSAGQFLYAGSEATGGITGFALSTGGTASLAGQWLVDGHGGDFRLTDLALSEAGGSAHLVAAESDVSAHIESFRLSISGSLSNTGQLSYSGATPSATGLVHAFDVDGTSLVATADTGASGLTLWQESGSGALTHRSTLSASPKTALEHVSDVTTFEVGGSTYMLTTSAETNAISSFAVSASGETRLVDTLDNAPGFWVYGAGDITPLSAFGTQYAAVAGTNSSSITLVEVAPNGTLHITDHVTDTLATRFSHIGALAGFNIGERGFLLAGGADDGLSLLEILPDGRLFPHESLAQQTGWSLADVTAIEAVETGNEIQIFVAGTGEEGITQLTIPKGMIADPEIGTASANYFSGGNGSDLFYGGGGADTLIGGDGDDLLYGGAGLDRLTGGSGADVFIFDADTETDQVQDFELGTDRLDLGRWGRIYDSASLTIGPRSNGALVRYEDHSVRLYSADGGRLEASDFSNDDFLFTGNGFLLTEATATQSAESGAMITGLGGALGYGETALARSDDGSLTINASALFSEGLHYFGTHYSGAAISVNTNGTVSLGASSSARPIGAAPEAPQMDIIALFWADIDTRTDGFGPDSGRIWVDQSAATGTLTVTWADVGAYRFNAGATNSFQLQLSDQGQGDFDITFRYGHIDWASAAAPEDGGASAFLAGSRLPEAISLSPDPLMLDETVGNTGETGVWNWQMRGGTIAGTATADGVVRLGTAAGDVLTGGADDDLLKGQEGPDILRGNDGADWLYGGDGADTLNAGAGNDRIIGGDSAADLRDVIYAGSGNDTIDAGYGNDLVYGGDGNDHIAGGFGVDELIGQGGDDVITGSAWSDEIFGGVGDDFLNGGFGCDRINGGAGADRFYHLGIADHGNDWIQDYNAAEGDVLLAGGGIGPATASDFLVQYSETDGAGMAGTEEAFITHVPSGLLMWALVDGAAEDHIFLRSNGETFDLLS